MIEEQTILTSERLRDDLDDFRRLLSAKYKPDSKQVTSESLRKQASRLAEIWLVELATNEELSAAISADRVADLSVHFQRLLTLSEHASVRSRYDTEIRGILKDYSVNVIVPLKQARGKNLSSPRSLAVDLPNTAFLGQSFTDKDKIVNDCVRETLEALGIAVVTGERPRGNRISEKVKKLIEEQGIFVGVFTRRDKIARKKEWTTSSWVIDEKAYAVALKKRLILLKENGVDSIGGIQGDYEFIDFSRDALQGLAVRLVLLFELTNSGLRK